MEQWQCRRVCFFRNQLFTEGMITGGEEFEIPRHFKSMVDGRPGTLGKAKTEAQKEEPKIQLEELMKGSPLLEKAKHLSQMNKVELCAYGRSLGAIFNAEEMTRAEMIRDCTILKEKFGTTNQEMADVAKR